MSMLHIVNKSPFERNSLDSCIGLSEEGSSILLIEDAVVAARAGTAFEAKLKEAMSNRKVFALGPDLEARAIASDKILDGVEVVDYSGFVNLTIEHANLQSWL